MKATIIALSLLALTACNGHQLGGAGRGLNAGVAATAPSVYSPNLWPSHGYEAMRSYTFQGRRMTCFQGQFATNCY